MCAVYRVEKVPRAGSQFCDEKGKKIGTVKEIFGPVKRPYVFVRESKR